MLFDKIVRWAQRGVADRSGLLSTPTALVIDPTQPGDAPELISLEQWLKTQKERTPAKAVTFLELYLDWTIATIVDVEQRVIATRIKLESQSLGTFTMIFLRTRNSTDTRSILLAPKWMLGPTKQLAHGEARAPSSVLKTALSMAAGKGESDGDGASPSGITMPGDKPPKPPRIQAIAIATLAEETAAIQSLPIISGEQVA